MPRASWRGFLRLSLVSCPVYLSPATTRTKSIPLRQVWQPAPADEAEDESPEQRRSEELGEPSRPALLPRSDGHDAGETWGATRITIRPHDPRTGVEIDKAEVVKGYEYGRGQFVTFTAEELKALDVESSKVIDLEKFASRSDIDPVYFDTPYYLYPDGPIAVEALRVIGAAMAEAGVVGIGRLTLSRRERMVMVEPRGTGMALFTLRAADEVRPAQFGNVEGEVDAEMVAIAKAIIAQRTATFDPTTYRDRYQEALRQLIEAKMKGLPIKPRALSAPPPVIDLMAALKRSLAQEKPSKEPKPRAAPKRKASVTDRRQAALLLPLPGARDREQQSVAKATSNTPRRRKKA
jgi:DNA end-binding protein Ku